MLDYSVTKIGCEYFPSDWSRNDKDNTFAYLISLCIYLTS